MDVFDDKDKEFTLQEMTDIIRQEMARRVAEKPELQEKLQMDERRIRFYIQQGLIDRPNSRGRHARYSSRHLRQMRLLLDWQAENYSLTKMRELARERSPQQNLPLEAEEAVMFAISDGVALYAVLKKTDLSLGQIRIIASKAKRAYEKALKEQLDMEASVLDDFDEE